MTNRTIRLGTRGSRLALTQTQSIAESLRAAQPTLNVEVTIVQTTGDKILDSPLSRIGGKGVFTKEIEDALFRGEIDVAVHSLKDLPTEQPDGLALSAITRRDTPNDVLIAREEIDWQSLGPQARIGTSSLRRRAQVRLKNQQVQIDELRGNVPTRIRKMAEGQYDAIVLAAVGVKRLELTPPWHRPLEFDEMLPAPGQGALGLQIRADDEEVHELLAAIHHDESAACCTAERALLHGLGGGCQLPLGTIAEIAGGQLRLRGVISSLDGALSARGEESGAPGEATELGERLAKRLLKDGGYKILEQLNLHDSLAGFHEAVARSQAMDARPLGGQTVLVTRDEDTDGPLSQAIREAGGHPVCLPLVRHTAPEEEEPLRSAVSDIDNYTWLVFTSFRGVEPVVRLLHESGRRLSDYSGRIACVGSGTARAVEQAGGKVEIVPEQGTGKALAEELTRAGIGRNDRVFYPRANLARPDLAEALRQAGAHVDDIEAYRTVRIRAGNALHEAFRTRRPDAILFCSSSAVEALADSLAGDDLHQFVSGVTLGSIGPSTSDSLKQAGLRVDVEAEDRTFEGLVAALTKKLAHQ